MTGAFVPVKRDGTWQNVEIDQLTDVELDEFAAGKPDYGWVWAKFLAKWIRDNGRQGDNGRQEVIEP